MPPHSIPARQVERQLVAILAADIAGYSRLMGADEEGTLAELRACQTELIGPCITAHHGGIFKTTGDGMLVRFASPVEATRCAVEIQQGMTARNSDLPDHKRLQFRIGINLGDVIVEDGDIFGDGVNVAARLEALAEPGGILHLAVGSRSGPRQSGTCDRGFGRTTGQKYRSTVARLSTW